MQFGSVWLVHCGGCGPRYTEVERVAWESRLLWVNWICTQWPRSSTPEPGRHHNLHPTTKPTGRFYPLHTITLIMSDWKLWLVCKDFKRRFQFPHEQFIVKMRFGSLARCTLCYLPCPPKAPKILDMLVLLSECSTDNSVMSIHVPHISTLYLPRTDDQNLHGFRGTKVSQAASKCPLVWESAGT